MLLGVWSYDAAVARGQSGNWTTAKQQLTTLLAEEPDRADILYDTGVASYKLGEHEKALAYFNKAAEQGNQDKNLQEQIHFNAGNAHVQLKQLQEAIDAYDRVLALNPTHERAKHNKEIVKKMLKQEKQDKNKKKKQDKKDKKDEQEQNDQDQSENKDEQNQNNDQKEKDDQQSSGKKQSQQDGQKDEQEQNGGDQDKNEQDKSGKEKSRDMKPQDKKGTEQASHESSSQNKEKKEDKGQQEKSSSQNQQQMAQQSGKEKDAYKEEGDKDQLGSPLDARTARLLAQQEKKDAQLNKQLIKAMVGTKGGPRNEYNNW